MAAEAAPSGPKARMAVGLLLMVFGIVLTLDQSGVLETGGLSRWWPLLPLGIGLVKLRQPPEDGQRAAGVAFMVMGGFFLLINVLTWSKAWPLVLVGTGALLLWQGVKGEDEAPQRLADGPRLSEVVVMGGSKRSLHAADFQGGYITAVLGGIELDLRKCVIAKEATLDVVAFWGMIALKVPAAWAVDARVTPIMGAFDDKTHVLVAGEATPRLTVRGQAIMAGIEIAN